MFRCLRYLFLVLLPLVKVEAGEFQLQLNRDERYAVTEIVRTMGEKNIASLLFDSRRLTHLGNSIQHVPPLQFLGFILVDPHLKGCLKVISESYFKWPPFLEGFGENMNKEESEGRLFYDLPGFARLVGGDLQQLEGYSHQKAWGDFVKSLL